MYFWSIRYHNSGYTLVRAMQLVLDVRPVTTKLRVRTSQGHILIVRVNAFSIVEVPVTAFTITYTCNLKLGERSESDCITRYDMTQHTTGEGGPFLWVYILFRGDGAANTEQQDLRVVLDLVSPMLYFRGLGGEIFSVECLNEYHTKLLSRGALEGGPFKRTSRIGFVPILCERILKLSQCQRESSPAFRKSRAGTRFYVRIAGRRWRNRCAQCVGRVRYCEKKCQTKGWKYHKTWCKIDARLA
jgi:hypothetical protein